jgi:hypothetical protein
MFYINERKNVHDELDVKVITLGGYAMVNRKNFFSLGYVFTASQASHYPPGSAPQMITIKK